MSLVAWLIAATLRPTSTRNPSCVPPMLDTFQPMARSGQSSCSNRPAAWIASYSVFIASASAPMYSSSLG